VNKHLRNPLLVSLLATLSSQVAADVVFDTYHFDGRTPGPGQSVYDANHDNKGIPLDLTLSTTVSAELMDRIALAVPEGRDVREAGVSLITDDAGGNITMSEAGDVWVTFLHEGAGYKNSLGYIAYPVNNPPASPEDVQHTIIFPNTSYAWSGGSSAGLRSGDQVYLGNFAKDTRITFFVVSNGWTSSGVQERWNDWVFYTLRGFNPEPPADDLNAHTVLLYDPDEEKIVLGIEDIKRTEGSCDHDFNDALFAIESNPPEAIQTEELLVITEVADRDGDGVPDAEDELPDDPLGAFLASYPSLDGYATIAFEDNWPHYGDFDFNDLVLRYQLDEIRDVYGDVTAIRGRFEMMARGAGWDSGFGIHFPGVAPSALASAEVSINGAAPTPLVSESGQSDLTLILVQNTKQQLAQGSYWCWYFNTQNCKEAEPIPFDFELIFAQPIPQGQIGAAPYNPFMFQTAHRHLEVHLPGNVPTDKVNPSIFGANWNKDDSDPTTGRYYLSIDNLPWAINLPVDWHHPLEWTDVTQAYPGMITWAESSGATALDWYLNPVSNKLFDRTVTGGN
jgi:LruC domain-containing protein